jgi:hypothetical protein
MSVAGVSVSQIPMKIGTAQEQPRSSLYNTFKQYISYSRGAPSEPRPPRTYFSLAKQYLPTSIYLLAGLGTCYNAYNGDVLNALSSAGGGLVAMLFHDTCLGGPQAPIITPQQIVDLESRQAANAHLMEEESKDAAILAQGEKEEEKTLEGERAALDRNNAGLTHVIEIESENTKEGDQLIDGLENTYNTNVEFLKNLRKG